jgi:hypothetical protein
MLRCFAGWPGSYSGKRNQDGYGDSLRFTPGSNYRRGYLSVELLDSKAAAVVCGLDIDSSELPSLYAKC